MSISTYGATEAVPPVSAIRSSSSSVESVQWMYVVSGPSRPRSSRFLTWCTWMLVSRMPDVHADADPEVARELPVVLRDLEVRVARRPGRERERQQLVVGGEVRLPDAPDVLRVVQLAERPPLAARRHAVRVDRPDAGVLQPLDRRIGVIGRVVDVRPVEERRHAAVERLQRTRVVADVDILGAVVAADAAEHHLEVRDRACSTGGHRGPASARCAGACRRNPA